MDEQEASNPPVSDAVTRKDARGLGTSALIAGGLFALPWLLVLTVAFWADMQPANDLVVELYQPLEAVYLQLDPPVDAVEDLDAVVDGADLEDIDGEEVEEAPREAPDDEGGGAGTEDGGDKVVGDETDGAVAVGEDGGDGEGTGEGEGVGDGKEEGDGKSPPTRRKRRASRCAADHPNVREASDGIVEVDRSLVTYYTASLSRFMELGYSEPYERKGIKGFYVGGFGCSSPVYKAGLRRGDMLITVNGKKTRSWIGVYLLYKKLRKQTDFDVELLRRGKESPQIVKFRIVEDGRRRRK